MKKTYTLTVEGKSPARLLDASKHDIRKYVKRERAKPLPVGVDFWDFDCKLGASADDAASVHLSALLSSIDSLVSSGAAQFYVEVATKTGRRMSRSPVEFKAESSDLTQGESSAIAASQH